MDRVYVEALVMGLLIGATVLILQGVLGGTRWPTRLSVLLAAGLLLCLVQYAIGRLRRR
jgi:hypothetical protein